MEYSRYGEDGVRIIFGNTIEFEINEAIRKYYLFIKSLERREIIDIIPSLRSCLIHYDSRLTSFDGFVSFLREKEKEAHEVKVAEPRTHRISVRYGGEYGPDMEFVCSYSGLAQNEVVEIHSSRIYRVFAVGFMPGFPYMGIVDRRIYVPRLDTPRLKVPEGSIGLAQFQTGIYPFECPAGWRIIGKTNVELFDCRKAPYSLFQIGDLVRFVPT